MFFHKRDSQKLQIIVYIKIVFCSVFGQIYSAWTARSDAFTSIVLNESSGNNPIVWSFLKEHKRNLFQQSFDQIKNLICFYYYSISREYAILDIWEQLILVSDFSTVSFSYHHFRSISFVKLICCVSHFSTSGCRTMLGYQGKEKTPHSSEGCSSNRFPKLIRMPHQYSFLWDK